MALRHGRNNSSIPGEPALRIRRQKKKWFQVTQAAIRSPAGMRGQSIACNVAEAVILLLPATVFLLTGYGSTLQNSLALPPARSQRLETAFRSPATTVLLREPPRRGQRSWPISSTKF
jgi:hypothetical protein